MKFKIFALALLFTTLLLSCKNSEEETNSENSGIKPTETSKNSETEVSTIDKEAILHSLQGNWKEPEYPYNVVQFRNNEVKFIEEGVAEEPVFQEYKITRECPFKVNNMKNVRADDVILVLVETRTCERIKVSDNTLILSGYNAHTGEEYQIIYKREE